MYSQSTWTNMLRVLNHLLHLTTQRTLPTNVTTVVPLSLATTALPPPSSPPASSTPQIQGHLQHHHNQCRHSINTNPNTDTVNLTMLKPEFQVDVRLTLSPLPLSSFSWSGPQNLKENSSTCAKWSIQRMILRSLFINGKILGPVKNLFNSKSRQSSAHSTNRSLIYG